MCVLGRGPNSREPSLILNYFFALGSPVPGSELKINKTLFSEGPSLAWSQTIFA